VGRKKWFKLLRDLKFAEGTGYFRNFTKMVSGGFELLTNLVRPRDIKRDPDWTQVIPLNLRPANDKITSLLW
jgi:hypothetical protein